MMADGPGQGHIQENSGNCVVENNRFQLQNGT